VSYTAHDVKRIPESVISDLLARVDLVELIGCHVPLVKKGKNYFGRCPFHEEKTPSFTVVPDKNFFHCFGCGASGDAIQFLMKHDGLSFPAAVEKLSGGEVQRESRPAQRTSNMDRLRISSTQAIPLSEEWLAKLKGWQARLPEAEAYLNSRRIPLEVARSLGAGVGEFGGAKRIIFPHVDENGLPVSLYGRRIDGGQTHKHHHLENVPKGFLCGLARSPELWLVEGAFDALALMAAGIPNVACVFGVAGIRWEWIKARKVVLAFDADTAGRAAIETAAKQAHLRGIEVAYLTADELGGAKDVSEAWQRGILNIQRPLLERVRSIRCLPGYDPAEFEKYRESALRFAQRFALNGWTELEVFGLPDPSRDWDGGACWVLRDHQIAEVLPDRIVCRRPGEKASYIRGGWKPEVLPWK
jgi:DNA primase